jgi:hypothetical protein
MLLPVFGVSKSPYLIGARELSSDITHVKNYWTSEKEVPEAFECYIPFSSLTDTVNQTAYLTSDTCCDADLALSIDPGFPFLIRISIEVRG